MEVYKSKQGQAMPGPTHYINEEAFNENNCTEVRWLGNASIMINSHGTVIMIDPLLEGFDMPLLIDMPILPKDIPSLDALLITHIDNDHFSVPTCLDVLPICKSYHTTQYVSEVMKEKGIPSIGHNINDTFTINDLKITLTPTWHNWQNDSSKYQYRHWNKKDYCGFFIETVDGTLWLPGDSKLLDEHLQMPHPDMILLDFSDNEWHITLEGAIKLANTYPEARLLCIHWGSVDSPDYSAFNGNPEDLLGDVINPERILVTAPGEAVKL